MHRAAVDADREMRAANEPDELQDRGVVEQIHAILWGWHFLFCPTDDDDATRSERVAKFLHRPIGERFAPPAGEGMEEDKRFILVETRDRIAAGEGKTQGARHRHPEVLDEREVALDGVSVAIDRGGLPVEKMRALARVAHPVEFPRVTRLPNQCAPEEALKIKRDVRLEAGGFVQPGEEMARHAEAAEIAPGENMDVIDAAIAAQKRGPFGVDHPGDGGLRVSVADESGGGQSVDDVT